MRHHSLLVLPLLAAIALPACQSAGERYPSLAIRDAERVQGTFDVDGAPAPVATPSPVAQDTLARAAQLLEQATAAHGEFMNATPGARTDVASARGAGVTDDRWARAQVALADLDSARSSAAIALGDLDLMYADATLTFTQRDEIGSTRDQVTALIAQEDRILAELRGTLAR